MHTFASESTIHGVNFIFGENRSWFVRILWVLLVIISFCGFSYYFQVAFLKWQISPDIAMKSREKSSKELPMPAITICPSLFARDDLITFEKVMNIFSKKEAVNGTRAECEVLVASINWCNLETIRSVINMICQKWMSEIDAIDVIKLMRESAYDLDTLFPIDTQTHLSQLFTHRGICFSYNLLDLRGIFNEKVIHEDFLSYRNTENPELEWTVERGYLDIVH